MTFPEWNKAILRPGACVYYFFSDNRERFSFHVDPDTGLPQLRKQVYVVSMQEWITEKTYDPGYSTVAKQNVYIYPTIGRRIAHALCILLVITLFIMIGLITTPLWR